MTVGETTDTVKLRAEFPNPSKQLVSGQFVSVLLEYDAPVEKISVSQAAVMSSPTGKYVYVVDAQNKVVNKPIVVGGEQGKDYIVNEGLEAGDRVMIEGLQKVRPGAEVIIDTPAAKTVNAAKKTAEPAKK